MPEKTGLDRLEDLRKRRMDSSRSESEELPPRVVAEFSAKALRSNYLAIQALTPKQAMIPMVKADAYGHGMAWTAQTLLEMPDLYGFGVATLEEGAELRTAIGMRARRARVIVFSGAAPWSEEKGRFCEKNGLTPAIASDEDWRAFVKGGWPSKIPYELKFNTGMNRLGLSAGNVRNVIKTLKALPIEAQPQGVFSHFAIAEDPQAKLTLSQVERFASLRSELSGAFPSAQFHLCNSAGIWNYRALKLEGMTDAVRPGISLYGVPPWAEASNRGLQPVMTFKARVAAVHALKPGESIGYGATYRVPAQARELVHAAVLSAGYADGVRRMLSNEGHAWLGGRPTRFLGIVSMDLSAVGATASTRVGEMAELLGPNVDIWAQSRAAGTIPYELLTSLSSRVQRVYG